MKSSITIVLILLGVFGLSVDNLAAQETGQSSDETFFAHPVELPDLTGRNVLILDVRTGARRDYGAVVSEVLHGQYWVLSWLHIEADLAFSSMMDGQGSVLSELGNPHIGAGLHLQLIEKLHVALRFQLSIPVMQYTRDPQPDENGQISEPLIGGEPARRVRHRQMTYAYPKQPSFFHEDRLDLIVSLHLAYQLEWMVLQLEWGAPVSFPLAHAEDPEYNPKAGMTYGFQASFRLWKFLSAGAGISGLYRWEAGFSHFGAANATFSAQWRSLISDLYVLVPYDRPITRIYSVMVGIRIGVAL